MIAAAGTGHGRFGIDVLVARLADPGFTIRFRRVPALRERGGHVSPAVLAVSSPRSRYVRAWRRHARSCPDCAAVFAYLGLSLR